jgi:hypothetical protein
MKFVFGPQKFISRLSLLLFEFLEELLIFANFQDPQMQSKDAFTIASSHLDCPVIQPLFYLSNLVLANVQLSLSPQY